MGFGEKTAFQDLDQDTLQGYTYALIYRSEGIGLYKTAEIDTAFLLDAASYTADSNLEARLFDESGELHLFQTDRDVKAVRTRFDDAEHADEKYKIDPHFKKNVQTAGKLIVRKLLDWDEDGQVYVKQTCLAGVEV